MTVLLPAASAEAQPRSIVDTRVPEVEANGSILLADDEPEVLELEELMLESAGFDVVAVEDGLRAVEAFRERPKAFQCVVLDLTMPVMDGEEAFRALRSIRPDVPVILCSGYSSQEILARFDEERPDGFLEKPFTSDALLSLISQVVPSRS